MITKSKKVMHQNGLGVCKDGTCKYFMKQVPIRLWKFGAGVYACPACGWGIAPESMKIEKNPELTNQI